MANQTVPIPKGANGAYDKETVRIAFMASPYLDWVRFAEEQNWDPHRSRLDFPVRTWQDEKKRRLSEAQGDVIAGLLHERQYEWTRQILDTLKRYPQLIDMGSHLAEAKMSSLAELYKEYVDWKKAGHHLVKNNRTGQVKRILHPWEKVSPMDISFMLRSLKDITDAKIKALMMDKWSMKRMDVPKEELEPQDATRAAHTGRITIEGKSEITYADMQRWFDEFADKPIETEVKTADPSERAITPQQYSANQVGVVTAPPSIPGLLGDDGQPIVPPPIPKREDG